jgi:hypothetical protein
MDSEDLKTKRPENVGSSHAQPMDTASAVNKTNRITVTCKIYYVGKDMDRTLVERIFRELIISDALVEYHIVNNMGFTSTYIRVRHLTVCVCANII